MWFQWPVRAYLEFHANDPDFPPGQGDSAVSRFIFPSALRRKFPLLEGVATEERRLSDAAGSTLGPNVLIEGGLSGWWRCRYNDHAGCAADLASGQRRGPDLSPALGIRGH